MKTTQRREALKMIEAMPRDASLEDIMYELYFRQRVDRGLREMKAGRTVSHRPVKRSVAGWLRSAGR
jgi:predicted transcriptional regulator